MESTIARAIHLTSSPVALLLSDEKPENALQFKEGKWGCVMLMFANAVKGKTAVFTRRTYGCWGGGVGLGFGNAYEDFPGGQDCFTYFLSSGNSQWDKGKEVGAFLESVAGKAFTEDFLNGEAYRETPELVRDFIENLPITDVEKEYVILKPLSEVNPATETPETIIFPVTADQVSALTTLANYARQGIENVFVPWAAGCQTIGILPLKEGKSHQPRAIIGLTDLSARKFVRTLLGKDILSFALPWTMFLEMEKKVPGSFLEKPTWQSLLES
ncbi:DUF169 domain-containing protein [Desulfobotulus mexicanus]|uniref:DUF169 domain-containing protein n=1 Tax=Desulfobotulus mexicanus TaxID=2586642 RepID=A0A5Q4VGT4_9BACT|nr:DUF169 domain-containing protein [Desulfobotulus mexicanus]TYT75482.1 hypothetical protein FIM25_05230 [Desulfobotulus mexicanus]